MKKGEFGAMMAMKRRRSWVLAVALALGASPAFGTVISPSARWQNLGDLYADSVLMTSHSLGVGSVSRAWSLAWYCRSAFSS